jgi:hypothetical protein
MRVEWLVEIIVRALFKRQGAFRSLSYLCQENGRSPDLGFAEAAQGLTSIHARHKDIEDDQFGMMSLRLFQRADAIRNDQRGSAAQEWRGISASLDHHQQGGSGSVGCHGFLTSPDGGV